jgi:hypothetical protein
VLIGVRPEVSMNQVIEWLNQHNINAVNAIGTLVILLLALIVIPILSRLLNQWLTYLQSPLNFTDKTNFIINRVAIAVFWALTVFIILEMSAFGTKRTSRD